MEMQRRALALADELGAARPLVFFNAGWVPYAAARRVLARGRRRRLGALRRPRDPVRVPHAAARLLLGRPPGRVHAGDSLGDLVQERAARRGRSRRETSTAGCARSRSCSTTTRSARARRRAPRRRPRRALLAPRRRAAAPARGRRARRRRPRCRGSPAPSTAAARLENALRCARRRASRRPGSSQRLTGRSRPLEERARPPLR